MSIWTRLRNDVDARLADLVDRRRVVGFTDDGRARVQTLNPSGNYEESVPMLRGVFVEIGDDAVLLRLGGRYVIIGALPADTAGA